MIDEEPSRTKLESVLSMSEIKVLFVCTGNICRSPTAEGVLRGQLTAAKLEARVAVDSCGLIDFHAGDPPTPMAIEYAQQRGYDLSELRARRFRKKDFEEFDLIVSMDRGHHMQLLGMCPDRAVGKLYLFMDFATPPVRNPDVPDPYYGGPGDYTHALDLIEDGVGGLIEALKRDHL